MYNICITYVAQPPKRAGCRLAHRIGLCRGATLQKRAIQFGTRIANKNVCGAAMLNDSVELVEVVHPSAREARDAKKRDAQKTHPSAGAATTTSADGSAPGRVRSSLSKKAKGWASTRAAPAIGQAGVAATPEAES